MPARWRIELLGGLRARNGERKVERFRSQKTGALLGYLAFHRDRMHPREVLVELLWPGCEPEAGRSRLSTAIWSLRRQLEPPGTPSGAMIRTDRVAVGLNPEAVTTDVAEFERLLRAARGEPGPGRTRLLAEAVEQYGGEFLAGYYEDWIFPEQGRLNELFHEALAELLARLEEAGEMDRALEYAWRGVRLDPLQEEAHTHLMRLQAAAGHPDLALRQYRELKRLLARELDTTPSSTAQALARRLEQEARTAVPEPVESPPEPPPVLPAPAPPPVGTVTFLLAEEGQGEAPDTQTLRHPDTQTPRHSDTPTPQYLFQAALERAVRQHRGLVVSPATSFLAAFDCAADALAGAIAAQQGITSLAEGPADRGLRIGLDTGRVEWRDGRYHGAVLDRAPRVLRAAHPGQILCSERTAALARLDLDPRVRLTDLGVYRLSEGAAPEHLFQAEAPGLRRDFPPPVALAGHPGHLPSPLTRFFGREDELARLQEMLTAGERRLVTVLGPSGIGKTRLALETGKRLVEPFRGAVWFVSLAEVAESERIPDAILRALGTEGEPSRDPFQQVAEALSGQPGLLILDNLEHLLGAGLMVNGSMVHGSTISHQPSAISHQPSTINHQPSAISLIQTLLERIPTLTCLVTSRHRLGLPGEQEFSLEPLPPPPGGQTPAELLHWASVQLFVDRAQAVVPDFQVTKANAGAVAALCAGLEGIPLSLELAAARTSFLTPAQMVERLDERLDLLVTRDNFRPVRHRSVRAAMECCVEFLAPGLREFFGRLSVFRGGWTLEAAEEVCQEPLAADHLAELRDHSLIVAETQGVPWRFRMLETLREFAWDRLSAEERQTVQDRHVEYFLQLAKAGEVALYRSEPGDWMERLTADQDNLRTAFAWALNDRTETALRIAVALNPYWDRRGLWMEAQETLQRALARDPGGRSDIHGPAWMCAGWHAYLLGDYQVAQSHLQTSLEIEREVGEWDCVAITLHALALVEWAQDHLESARALHQEGLTLARQLGFQDGVVRALRGLGDVALARGELPEARSLFEEALVFCRQIGKPGEVKTSLYALGSVALAEGDLDTAVRLYEESLAISRELEIIRYDFLNLVGLGEVALRRGDLPAARTHFADVLTRARELKGRQHVGDALFGLGRVARAEGNLDQARSCLEECLEIRRAAGQRRATVPVYEELARVAERAGQPTAAVRCWASAAALRDTLEPDVAAAGPPPADDRLAALRNALGDAAFEAAWEEGWSGASDQ